MDRVRIRPEREIRKAVGTAFTRHRRRILETIPGAEVEHVGATSVPGALTRGDLDLLVRVDAERFDDAVEALHHLYDVHQTENWTSTFASFVERTADDLPVGVQVVVGESPDDALFAEFRDALIRDSALLAEYNALKERHNGETYERYTAAKAAFIERLPRR